MDVDVESYFAQYEDIAVEVVDNTNPNTDVALPYSNRELAEIVCQTMGWEDFDMFSSHDMEQVHMTGDGKTCLAYGFLSFLRWRMFTIAQQRGIGLPAFNEKAASYSEYWYIALVDQWNSKAVATDSPKKWRN